MSKSPKEPEEEPAEEPRSAVQDDHMEPSSTRYGLYAFITWVCWFLVLYLIFGPVPGFGEGFGSSRCGQLVDARFGRGNCDELLVRQIAWIGIALVVSQFTLVIWVRRASWADLKRRVPKP